MKDSPLIYVVLINYNSWGDTLECLASLEGVRYDNFRAIVVDNHSSKVPEPVATQVRRKADIFIDADRNGGFAYGNNLGISKALEHGADYVFLLNNDTTVDPSVLEKMSHRACNKQNLGILGCQITYYGNRQEIWFNGGYLEPLRSTGYHYDIGRQVTAAPYRADIDFVTGCAMMIPSDVLRKVGFLDEGYFMYYEDLAYCIKVSMAGYEVDYVDEPLVYHKVSSSGGGGTENWVTVYYGNISRRKFLNSDFYSNRPTLRAAAYTWFYITRILKLAVFTLSGRKDLRSALIKGFRMRDLARTS